MKYLTAGRTRINLRQARVIRGMLRLGSFTRKQLADKSGEGTEYVNQVVKQYESFLQSKGWLRSGRPGPPEEVLVLTEQGEDAFLSELVGAEEGDSQLREGADWLSYVPAPMQYAVARELVDEVENRKNLPVTRLERLLWLFRNISETEDLPIETTIGESSKQDRSRWNDRQQIASARLDVLRGKLCWLSLDAPERMLEWDADKYFASDLGSLGLGHLQSASQTFRRYSGTELAEAVDYWSAKHVHSVLVLMLTQVFPLDLEAFSDAIDPDALPGVYKIVVNIVSPEPSEILDGLVQYYNQYCRVASEQAVALLDIRETGMTLAIVERNGRITAQCGPLPEKVLGNEGSINFVDKCLRNYQHGTVDHLFVTGDRVWTSKFNERAPHVIRKVQIGDFLRPTQKGYPMSAIGADLTQGEFLSAAEVGLTLKAAKVLGVGIEKGKLPSSS